MKNFIQNGDTVTLAAPYALASGEGFQVDSIFAIASDAVANGDNVEGCLEGVFTLPKTSAQAWTVGRRIYWDAINKRCDTAGTVGIFIGSAGAVAANPSATGVVIINDGLVQLLRGTQAAIPTIALADSVDLATAQALANQDKATINLILIALRNVGIIA